MTGPSARQLDVPGARLHYEVRGSGPLLLVIGQPMTSGPFAALADELAADHRVVTYDPRGLGRSTVDDPSLAVTPEVEADDVARLVEAVGGGPADVVASSGGAVTGLALAVRHPETVRTLIAHEPPVCDLLPDAAHVRAVVDGIAEAYRTGGSGAAWGGFVALVVHDGPLTGPSVPPPAWPPQGSDAAEPAEPTAKQQAEDELFFLRMLEPFTRYDAPVDVLRAGRPRVVVAVGADSRGEVAARAARELAARLGREPATFPRDHGGFLADPGAFAAAVREVLGAPG